MSGRVQPPTAMVEVVITRSGVLDEARRARVLALIQKMMDRRSDPREAAKP